MGVYINMEMPTSPVLFCIHPDGKVFVDREGNWREYKAVSVPPHGRMIDADKIGFTNAEIIMCQNGNPFKNALEMLFEKIENAPTAIEAEDGE